jgi:hypothetical protein
MNVQVMNTQLKDLIRQKVLSMAEREELEPDMDWNLVNELSEFIIALTLGHVEKAFRQVDANLANKVVSLARTRVETPKEQATP